MMSFYCSDLNMKKTSVFKCLIVLIRQLQGLIKMRKLREKGNVVEIHREDLHRIKLKIKGRDNVVRIGKLGASNGVIRLSICGDGNEITMGNGTKVGASLGIEVGMLSPNFDAVRAASVKIGNDCSFERVAIKLYNSNSSVNIGADCMFSYDINIWNTDAHPIFEKETGIIINYSRVLRVGNHVWVGAKATLLKNITVGDDCVIGWGSVVGRSCPEANCVIAGNPARVVKHGITWDADGKSCGYIANDWNLQGDAE